MTHTVLAATATVRVPADAWSPVRRRMLAVDRLAFESSARHNGGGE